MNVHAREDASAIPAIDPAAVEAHINMLHHLAASSGAEGVLVLFGVGENPLTGRNEGPRVEHFRIGDSASMIEAAKGYSYTPHLNAYAPWAIFRKGLPRGGKGSERDVVAVLALVADQDNDKGQGGTLPIEAPYIVESSPGNFQAVYPLSRALPPAEAKPLAQALAECVGCDHRTKDVSGVWRIPGLLNWPNKIKLGRGRSADPQPVTVAKEWSGDLIEPEALQALAGKTKREDSTRRERDESTGTDSTVAELLARCSAGLRKLITAPAEPGEDRSAVAFSVICSLLAKGFSTDDVRRLVEAHPNGIGGRYADGKDLDADIRRGQEKARPNDASDGPIPLFPPMPEAERFPIEALGPVLSRAAAAISRKVQVPEAIAAQSVLAVAALASQAHADVMLPYGQTRPLSLFFVTVAASGDRKSTADNEALWPIRKREKTLKEEHENEHRLWSIAFAAWSAEKKKVESDRKMDFDARRRALADLGPEPERPLHPFLTAPEPTIEGLVKAWSSAPAALGIFTAEGGMFIGGHGMSQDNRLRTAAGYSEMWDGHPIKRIRSLDGVSILYGRRLSMHLMVQHEAAAQFLADPLLRDQGLLSRVLVAAPESIAGTRFYRDTAPEDDAAIRSYGARILSILEAPWPLIDGRRNELEPRVLTITADAAESWRAFYDHIEGQCGPGNDLRPVQDFAAKIAEHAARIAGVLTIIDDFRASEIGIEAMHSSLTLADWYVNEAVRLQRAARTDPRLIRAQQLLDWMRERGEAVINFREIVQFGPSAIRTKTSAEEAVSVLTAHGWIEEVSPRPRRVRLVKEADG
ncbi:MAG: DUF3987 domain-containing protein [Xanthobacteraceae bacterium]|nr:DUF3987 domain-containing protein [Xanthobacteraceae bacterium]